MNDVDERREEREDDGLEQEQEGRAANSSTTTSSPIQNRFGNNKPSFVLYSGLFVLALIIVF